MELSELTTAAALLFDNKDYKAASTDILMLKKFSEQALKKIKTSKNIVFGNQSVKTDSIEKLTIQKGDTYSSENIKIMQDFLVGISAAKEIKIFMGKNRFKVTKNVKIYMTGGTWPQEIIKFKINAAGMPDYNSSDIMVSEDGKTFFGISLKKKKRVTEDDPTLINKAFDTILSSDEFKELNKELNQARINFFTDLVIEAVNKGYINYTDINDTNGKKIKDKREWKKFSTSAAGRNELYVSKKKDKSLFERRYINTKGSAFHPDGYITDQTTGDKSMRQWVNKQLSGKDSSLWKNFVLIMNQYSELFADRLIDIILKTNLFQYLDAETLKKYDFDFALVTGVGIVTKKSVTLNKGSLIPLGTTLCGLKRIEKKYKTAQFKVIVDEVKQSTSELAGVSMVLEKGNLTILNLVLRYKGDFSAQPTFTGTIDKQFKDLLKKECTGFR
tara:strand:- start:122 stop:1453 length:1332 start_codon:yes stop_codon:yes gene_type:complete